MRRLGYLMVAGLALTLVACASPAAPAATPVSAALGPSDNLKLRPAAAPTGTAAQSPTATTSALASAATLAAQLKAQLIPTLPAPATVSPPGTGTIGINDIGVLSLGAGPDGRPLFAAFTEGLRDFSANQTHFAAIYTPNGPNSFQELSRVSLPDSDFIDPDGVTQVQIDPKLIWLQVESGAGANSGCFDILSFDGTSLQDQAHQCLADPNRSRLEDVIGSGMQQVVLDQSDNLIFCHACGISKFKFSVLSWNGSSMVPVDLATLPASAGADLSRLTSRAVQLAQAGLWQEAQATIGQAQVLDGQDPTVKQDAGLIDLYANAFGQQASGGPYPLLDNVFFGDYPAALNAMRQLSPAEIFSQQTPLIVGTVAQGFESSLEQNLATSTTQAIQAEPSLAAAYYIRGWAEFLANPNSSDALTDVQGAAQLDPNEPLYAESVTFLKAQSGEQGQPTATPTP